MTGHAVLGNTKQTTQWCDVGAKQENSSRHSYIHDLPICCQDLHYMVTVCLLSMGIKIWSLVSWWWMYMLLLCDGFYLRPLSSKTKPKKSLEVTAIYLTRVTKKCYLTCSFLHKWKVSQLNNSSRSATWNIHFTKPSEVIIAVEIITYCIVSN